MSYSELDVSYTVVELGPADGMPGGTGPDHLRERRCHRQPPNGPLRNGPAVLTSARDGTCCRATPSSPPNRWLGVVRSVLTQLEYADDPASRSPADRPTAYLVIIRSPQRTAEPVPTSAPSAGWRPRPVDRAIKIMEADPGAISSMADLARATNVGVRTLQSAFRQHLGTSPMGYLRQLRLTRAHEELLAADPRRHTVAKIAHRHGFPHLGRFAATYRARYGHNPSTTLQTPPVDRQPSDWRLSA